MAKKSKNYYLKIKTNVKNIKPKKIGIHFDTSFFRMMKNNEVPINITTFTVLSGVCVAIVYILYATILKNQLLAIGVGIMSITIPYLVLKPTLIIKKMVDDSISYKSFIFSLESAIRATNSTQEALTLIAEESNLHKDVRNIINDINLNLKLGESIDKTLNDAILRANDVYIKMAFTILKINHSVGTSTTIIALENIQKNMDNRIDDIQLLKSKIDSLISEKSIFLLLSIASPIFLVFTLGSVLTDVFNNGLTSILLVLVYIFVFVGQFIINKKADNMIKEL